MHLRSTCNKFNWSHATWNRQSATWKGWSKPNSTAATKTTMSHHYDKNIHGEFATRTIQRRENENERNEERKNRAASLVTYSQINCSTCGPCSFSRSQTILFIRRSSFLLFLFRCMERNWQVLLFLQHTNEIDGIDRCANIVTCVRASASFAFTII